jgi:Tol biopolymer transport system component
MRALLALVLLVNGGSHIPLVDADTGRVGHVLLATDAKWSPRGDRFAFIRGGDLFVADFATLNEIRLTADALLQHDPAWSPDGRRIAFLQQRLAPINRGPGPPDDVAVVDVRTRTITQLTNDEMSKRRLSWSPSGRVLEYEFRRYVFGGVQFIDAANGRPIESRTEAAYVVWSPRGTRVAYVIPRNGWSSVVVARADGTNARTVFRGAPNRWIYDLAWSPDGGLLAFTYGRRIELVDTRTGRAKALLPVRSRPVWVPVDATGVPVRPSTRLDHAPAWSPDGQRIAFERYDGSIGRYALGVANRDGTKLHFFLASKHSVGTPAWRPRVR